MNHWSQFQAFERVDVVTLVGRTKCVTAFAPFSFFKCLRKWRSYNWCVGRKIASLLLGSYPITWSNNIEHNKWTSLKEKITSSKWIWAPQVSCRVTYLFVPRPLNEIIWIAPKDETLNLPVSPKNAAYCENYLMLRQIPTVLLLSAPRGQQHSEVGMPFCNSWLRVLRPRFCIDYTNNWKNPLCKSTVVFLWYRYNYA